MPVLFICALMLVLWIRYEVKKTKDISDCVSIAFWEREQQANHSRNKPIDGIPKITIPLDSLPLRDNVSEKRKQLQDHLIQLSTLPIMNLSDYTNTDLKLMYGVGHYNYLAECDANYLDLMNTLHELAIICENESHITDAIAYYESLIACDSENVLTYVRLAKLYQIQDNLAKLQELKQKIEQSAYKNKTLILQKIEQSLFDMLCSCSE